MTIIALVPLAIDRGDKKSIFGPLASHLASIFDASVTIIAEPPRLFDRKFHPSFDKQRNQLNSDKLLHGLATTITNNTKSYDPTKTITLGICNFDAYSLSLNFVFGQASLNGGVAVMYLPRLKQEFYGLGADRSIFIERVLKEATHEVGHVFGLNHCPKRSCVMHFSNSLADTDRKATDFCEICAEIIVSKI